MTESAARNAPQARPLFHLARVARLAAVALLILLVAQAETISYSYDPGNRLQSVEYDDGQSVHYVYDNLGNQLIRLTLAAPQANNPPGTVTPGLADGAEITYTDVTLDWSEATDPDADDAVVYYLHLGTGSEPPLVHSGWERSYTPPYRLQPLTTYTWSVIARDSQGAESVSGPWTFTTGNEPPTPIIEASPTEAIVSFTTSLRDASISTDDAIVARAWDFLCDGSVDVTTPTATYRVTAVGEYDICLAVTDEAGATEATTLMLYGRIDTDRDGVFDNVDNCPAVTPSPRAGTTAWPRHRCPALCVGRQRLLPAGRRHQRLQRAAAVSAGRPRLDGHRCRGRRQ
jgi:hypothetical protein